MSGVEDTDIGLAFGESVDGGSGKRPGVIREFDERRFDEHEFDAALDEWTGTRSPERLATGAPGETGPTRRRGNRSETSDRLPERRPARGAAEGSARRTDG